MKRKIFSAIIAFVVCMTTAFGLVACGEEESVSSGESVFESESQVSGIQPLTLEGFNSAYLPDMEAITARQLSGQVDVCLDFEGTQAGWQALAKEYERLHGGSVIVKVNTTYAGSTYSDKLNEQLTASKTEWDIVEGNLGYGNTIERCIDMFPTISSVNPYSGKGVMWSEVLKPEAYRTKEADNSGVSQIMNTEVMQTCWFINDVAFQKAVEKGYENADGEAGYPITWDDLINLCAKMVEAGYTNPLGITLCNASIESLQFTWLLRVYGDYYYRQFYKYITDEAEWSNYDPTDTVPENKGGFKNRYAKILNLLFAGETLSNGTSVAKSILGMRNVGFSSDLYLDFVGNIAKMKGYLIKDVEKTEFSELRDKFETQSQGNAAPQIMLDYQGFGITYDKAETASFKVGYFDYPTMESQYVPEETITRDIGGNGGFISVINHLGNTAQNELNKDFVKFVLSPYGQTIYYKGLADANKVPKGLTTVKNELVVIPNEWKAFFEESNKTITFSGDVDANNFLSWGVRYTCGETQGQKIICDNWRGLLMTGLGAEQTLNVRKFAALWGEAAFKDAQTLVNKYGWPAEVWTNPYYNLG